MQILNINGKKFQQYKKKKKKKKKIKQINKQTNNE